jgi:hypothetical protein
MLAGGAWRPLPRLPSAVTRRTDCPGYRFIDREEPQGRALDMVHCPIAGYMREQGVADLCVGTWCSLDFPLAEMWGGHLQRRGTLAGGAGRCDFRFVAGARHGVS